MKNIFTLFCLLLLNFTIAQSKSGIVEYSIADINVPVKEGMAPNEMVQNMIEVGKTQKFILEFSNKQSVFAIKEGMRNEKIDDYTFNLAKFYTTTEIFYTDLDRKEIIKKTEENILLKEENVKYDWMISKESKMIDQYLCYKATATFDVKVRGNQTKKRTITAWFAPSLPYSFGPIEFSGLPGLIIELHKSYTTYLATKISLNDKEIKITYPTGKTMTEEEYEQKIMSGSKF